MCGVVLRGKGRRDTSLGTGVWMGLCCGWWCGGWWCGMVVVVFGEVTILWVGVACGWGRIIGGVHVCEVCVNVGT